MTVRPVEDLEPVLMAGHRGALLFESDIHFDGWPGTDWIEALVLRLDGVEVYDQWLSHEIGDALVSGQLRIDASDFMPPEIGGVVGEPETGGAVRGAFLQGMLDYVAEGEGSLDGILATIDAAWPEQD